MAAVRKMLILLMAATISLASERISEESAISQLKKTPAYELDGALPNRTFGSWVNDKFRDWDIQWTMHACGEVKLKSGKNDVAQEGPVCVQVNIMQPGQKVHGDSSDGYHVLFLVGTEKHGLMAPRLFHAVRKNGDETEPLAGLVEVEP